MYTDHRALVEGDIPTDVASFTVHDGRVLWKRAQSLKMFKRQQLMYGDSVERLQLSYDGRLLLHIRCEIPRAFGQRLICYYLVREGEWGYA